MLLERLLVEPTGTRFLVTFGHVGDDLADPIDLPQARVIGQFLRRGHGDQSGHFQSGGHEQGQNASHRKSDDEDVIGQTPQQGIAIFHGGSPIGPVGADHIFGIGGVPGKSNAEAGMSLSVQIFPHPTHFFGRAGESMDQQTRGL